MAFDRLHRLKGKTVRIRAGGIDYKGKLLEVTAEYAFIRRQNGYAQIPMERIQEIRAAEEKPVALTTPNPADYAFEDSASPIPGGEPVAASPVTTPQNDTSTQETDSPIDLNDPFSEK